MGMKGPQHMATAVNLVLLTFAMQSQPPNCSHRQRIRHRGASSNIQVTSTVLTTTGTTVWTLTTWLWCLTAARYLEEDSGVDRDAHPPAMACCDASQRTAPPIMLCDSAHGGPWRDTSAGKLQQYARLVMLLQGVSGVSSGMHGSSDSNNSPSLSLEGVSS